MNTTDWPMDAEDKRDAVLRAMLKAPRPSAARPQAAGAVPLAKIREQLTDLLPAAHTRPQPPRRA